MAKRKQGRQYVDPKIKAAALERLQSGVPAAEVAEEAGVTVSSVYNWLHKAETNGSGDVPVDYVRPEDVQPDVLDVLFNCIEVLKPLNAIDRQRIVKLLSIALHMP